MNQTRPSASSDSALGDAPAITLPLPGPRAKDFMNRDTAVGSPSNTRDYPLVVNKAQGCVVEDVDGNRFLDLAAGIAVCATGHCHPKVTAAIEAQVRSLLHICGSDFYYPSMVQLMEKICSIVPGGAKHRVLLTNSGAEAVEAAFKLARHHTKRKWVIAFHGAFHGRTMGALSLTCSKAKQRGYFGPLIPMVAHVPYGDADAIENQLFRYKMAPDEVAAVFVEAMQGEGGYIVPPPDFLSKLRDLCTKHGIVMVCDEIQSGTGRTGKWFAYEHFGIEPDVILMAKGLASGMPLGAVVAREEVMDWPPGAQGSTFGGNPVCCAAAMATLDLVESQLKQNAASIGQKLLARLTTMADKHAVLTGVRGLGLMMGLDVVKAGSGHPDPATRAKILHKAFESGVILLPCGETGIRFCPPLIITEAQLTRGLDLFEQAVNAVVGR